MRGCGSAARGDCVVEADDAIGEAAGGKEGHFDGALGGGEEGDAFADDGGDDVEDEFIELAGIEEGGEEACAAHEPDV